MKHVWLYAAVVALLAAPLAVSAQDVPLPPPGAPAPPPPPVALPPPGVLPEPPQPPGIVLQGLDKVTARISTIEVPLNTLVRFGSLQIRVRSCQKTPPTEPPESAAFIEIDETASAGDVVRVFSGWMFASSPAVSALEHPVYDVWVVDCTNASSTPSSSSD